MTSSRVLSRPTLPLLPAIGSFAWACDWSTGLRLITRQRWRLASRCSTAATLPPRPWPATDAKGWDTGTWGVVGVAPWLGVCEPARIGSVAIQADWHRTRLVAWSLAGVTVLVLVAALVLVGLNAGRVGRGNVGANAFLAVAVLVYAVTGGLIASRLPGNAIGWLLCLIGLSLAASMFTEQYAVYGLATAPGSLPAARLAGCLSSVTAVAAVFPLFFLVLLFPDGRLPSRRWRPVLWALCTVVAGAAAHTLQAGTTVTGGITNALAAAKVTYPNPLGSSRGTAGSAASSWRSSCSR